jgi:hypothetical protein
MRSGIAAHDEGVDPPSVARTIQFPISSDAIAYKSASRRIQSLSSKVRLAIEGVQPYHRTHSELPPLLALLRDMNDSDKHRLLRLAMTPMQHCRLTKVEAPRGTRLQFGALIGPFKSGTEVIWINVDPPTPHVKFGYELFVTVCVSHPRGAANRPFTEVVPFLEWMVEEVRTVCAIVASAVV